LLIIARLDERGRWRVVYFDNQAAVRDLTAKGFRPLAVFDMDGDGRPEIVYHLDFGDSFSDVVLGSDNFGVWRPLAESVHGATA
jgi:hypothetical protein